MILNAPDIDEKSEIREVLAGNAEAYGAIVRRYQDRLVAAVYAMIGSREDAEDVTQECLAIAFRRLSTFEGRSSLFTWLHRIAMNLAISHRRKRRLENAHERTSMEFAELDLVGREEPVEQQIDRRDQQALVRAAVLQLDEQYRSVLVLRDVQGMDYGDIAETLQIPIGTVRSRLHRARLEIKDILELLMKKSLNT